MIPDVRLAVIAVFFSAVVFDFWFNSLLGQQGILQKCQQPLSQDFFYSVLIRFNICCLCLLLATVVDAFTIILDVFMLNKAYCISLMRHVL